MTDEQIELALSIERHKDKLESLLDGKTDAVLKAGEANDAYKLFLQLKKLEDRKTELELGLNETQELLKQFLTVLEGNKLSYKERDEQDKSKNTHLLWLEEGVIKTNRC